MIADYEARSTQTAGSVPGDEGTPLSKGNSPTDELTYDELKEIRGPGSLGSRVARAGKARPSLQPARACKTTALEPR